MPPSQTAPPHRLTTTLASVEEAGVKVGEAEKEGEKNKM